MVAWVGLQTLVFLVGSLTRAPGAEPPQTVVNGSEAGACEFPATVAMINQDGQTSCTGALLHPRIVMLAAHCIDAGDSAAVGFGETVQSFEATVDVVGCIAHPQYDPFGPGGLFAYDLALCELAEDAPDVPIVPALMGCEAEELVPDASITLVGFGFNDEFGSSGNDRKRLTVNTLERVDEENNDLYVLGIDDSSVCFGDSGGPAYMQLSDGSWRLVGITSQPHPDAFSQGTGAVCGYGALYDLVHLEMAWVEETTGVDLTPCHDPDGTWSPTEECVGFPMSLDDAAEWADACSTNSVSGFSAICGEPFESAAGSTGGDTDDGTSTGEATTGPQGTTGEPPPEPEPEPGTDVGTSGPEPMQDVGGDDGCGCRQSRSGPVPLWLLLALPLLRRRRFR